VTEPSLPEPAGPLFHPEPMHAPAHYPFPHATEALLPWSHAEARLTAARNYWLATTRRDGPPHLTPLWGVWMDAAFYFDGLAGTRWARNLATDPRATLHLESAEDVVIVEGVVHDVATDPDTAARITAAWDAKYGRLTPEPTKGVYRLTAQRARGWSHSSLHDGTRWTPTTR
jgi:Pyridoxamine 5'-phosphate oxidase